MNYKQLIEDSREGRIDWSKWELVFDNDGGYWSFNAKGLDEEHITNLEAEMKAKYGEPGGYEDLVDIASAAGINATWC